ncbi:hypothetical protein CLV51_101683 [Chitinophaga niastensis]|uniref:Uncharacterized protein n=1 Tax=Chitinophaga niastensis TaxID=536980 RepID=A0A2P8HT23_CHINA|nr:hypothetical protein [Chitinophaga niastensis]PSL49352.1 hypothetical protein CLV51_101683 [Chitinophaga niastensis]
MEKKYIPNLWVCILMDLLGCASYTVPVLGEASDIIWAPISAFIFYRMFGGTLGTFGSVFNFLEELLPGTDFIPTFTLSWILKRIWASRRAMSI